MLIHFMVDLWTFCWKPVYPTPFANLWLLKFPVAARDSTETRLAASMPSGDSNHTPSPPIKRFPTKSPWVKLSGRLPVQLYGYDMSHPLELRVCLSQTLWNRIELAASMPSGDSNHSNISHTCHILPPSEIVRGLFWAVFTGSEVHIYFVEWAERVIYGNSVSMISSATGNIYFFFGGGGPTKESQSDRE